MFATWIYGLFFENETHRLHRVVKNHPRTNVAHHFADLLPHIIPITMHRALVALGLVLAKLASV